MPCYGPDGPPNVRSDIAERRLQEAYQELDRVTRVACSLSKAVLYKTRPSQEAYDWMKEHEELDRKRHRKGSK